MQIDTKIDPRWCEALLGMLEGDLSHSRVAEAKRMLRSGIDSIRKIRPEAPPTGSLDELDEKSDIRKRAISRLQTRGCLFAIPGRGDCEHFVALPGKSIPGQHDGPDDTLDEYGRPNGWCEVCWRGRQIEMLQYALFNFAEQYGGKSYAIDVVRETKNKAKNGIIAREDFSPIPDCRKKTTGVVYVIEAKRLTEVGRPVYLTYKKSWNADVNEVMQFCQYEDAYRYAGKDDGTWKIAKHSVETYRKILPIRK